MKCYLITTPSLIQHGRVITRRSLPEAEQEAKRLSISNKEEVTVFAPSMCMRAKLVIEASPLENF